MTEMTNKPVIWCDMDGVIAVYERNDYIGQNPGYRKPDGHYFLYRPVDTKMAKVLYELYKRGYELHILSNINSDLPETIRSEMILDKKLWLNHNFPYIDKHESRHFITTDKASYITSHRCKNPGKTDVLISDFNRDLIPWIKYGKTGFKYGNGINDVTSCSGAIPLRAEMTADEIITAIINQAEKKEVNRYEI